MTDTDRAEMNAPLTELRLADAVRRYERLKLWLLVFVACTSIALSFYGVGLLHSTKKTVDQSAQTLVILRCAIDRATSVDAHGQPRTAADARRVLDACLERGGPTTTTTTRKQHP